MLDDFFAELRFEPPDFFAELDDELRLRELERCPRALDDELFLCDELDRLLALLDPFLEPRDEDLRAVAIGSSLLRY